MKNTVHASGACGLDACLTGDQVFDLAGSATFFHGVFIKYFLRSFSPYFLPDKGQGSLKNVVVLRFLVNSSSSSVKVHGLL